MGVYYGWISHYSLLHCITKDIAIGRIIIYQTGPPELIILRESCVIIWLAWTYYHSRLSCIAKELAMEYMFGNETSCRRVASVFFIQAWLYHHIVWNTQDFGSNVSISQSIAMVIVFVNPSALAPLMSFSSA